MSFPFYLTVDTTPPTIISCPGGIQQVLELGSPGDNVVFVVPNATDLSESVMLISTSHSPGVFFPASAPTAVFYLFSDDSGNTASCSFCVEFILGKYKFVRGMS